MAVEAWWPEPAVYYTMLVFELPFELAVLPVMRLEVELAFCRQTAAVVY